MRTIRKIVKIYEDKCNGCGLCVPACAEGAIEIVDGKARLVSDAFCDGLGACLGECPQGAITVEDREAEPFDSEAVEHHLSQNAAEETASKTEPGAEHGPGHHTCPSAAVRVLKPRAAQDSRVVAEPSQLANWPIQIHLVPTSAPFLKDARLLIAADCVPFTFADFHHHFLAGRMLLVGCPKLDDAEAYRRKLAQIFAQNDIKSIDVVYMEVPCCFGLVNLVRAALEDSRQQIPLTLTKVGIGGEIEEISVPTTDQESAKRKAHETSAELREV